MKLSRRNFLALSCGAAGLVNTPLVLSGPVQAAEAKNVSPGLHQLAQIRKVDFGTCFSSHLIKGDPSYTDAVLANCGVIVPENEMKWEQLHPTAERFDFSKSDRLAEFASRNHLSLRGHTLVWHLQQPAWIKAIDGAASAERILIDHIETVVGRYSQSVSSWDVVNEAIEPSHGRRDGLRQTIWLDLLGPEYLDLAFYAAHAAAPECQLVYNDYSLELANREHGKRRYHTLKLLEGMLARGVPVHALGIQGHLPADVGQFDSDTFAEFLRNVSGLGLKVLITELDVSDRNLRSNTEYRDRKVAEVYQAFLETALDNPAVTGILTWGLSDRYSWLQENRPRDDKIPMRPLPLDANLERKQAWHAIAKVFSTDPTWSRGSSASD